MTRKSFARLSLQSFEDRIAPATFKYDSASRTLTVTAADADQLTVAAVPSRATSFIKVTDAGNNVVFTSDTPLTRVVRNLVVKFDKVGTGTLTLDPTVRLGGALTVFGAKQTQTLTSDGVYGGGIYFHGTANAEDTLTFAGTTQAGGKVDLQLKDGADTVNLKGGFIGGDLVIDGDDGADTVNLLADGDLRVNGAANINLGDGANVLRAAGAFLLDIGKSVTYTGGINKDDVHLRSVDANSFDAVLRTGGSAVFNLDTNPAADGANDLQLNRVTVGGNLSVTGGGGTDTVQVVGLVTVGGDFKAKLHSGTNYLDPNKLVITGNRIGRSYAYSGGAGEDQVWLDGFTVGKGVNVNLGNAPAAADQYFKAGSYAGDTVYGKVKVKAGISSANTVVLHRMYIGHGIDLQLGNRADTVRIDDTDVSGLTHIVLGDGDDTLSVEMIASDFGGDLPGTTYFGGVVEFIGGLGNDTFNLGRKDGDPTSHLQFGPRVTVEGGDGTQDTLDLGLDVTFLADKNKDTCELGDNLA